MVFSDVDSSGTLTLVIEGSTRIYDVTKLSYCAGVLAFSLDHECDNRNKFNLDVGKYTGILKDDDFEITRFNFNVYKK